MGARVRVDGKNDGEKDEPMNKFRSLGVRSRTASSSSSSSGASHALPPLPSKTSPMPATIPLPASVAASVRTSPSLASISTNNAGSQSQSQTAPLSSGSLKTTPTMGSISQSQAQAQPTTPVTPALPPTSTPAPVPTAIPIISPHTIPTPMPSLPPVSALPLHPSIPPQSQSYPHPLSTHNPQPANHPAHNPRRTTSRCEEEQRGGELEGRRWGWGWVRKREKAGSVRSGVDGVGVNGHGEEMGRKMRFESVTKPKPRTLLALSQQPSSQSHHGQGLTNRQSAIYSDETSIRLSLADLPIDQGPPYSLHKHLTCSYLFQSGIMHALTDARELREEVLERFLRDVGYGRWVWRGRKGVELGLKDLNAYLHNISTPMHEYASIAEVFIAQHAPERPNGVVPPNSRVPRSLAASCRSFTRLLLRLREQAEAGLKERERAGLGSGSAPTSPRERDGRRTSMRSARSSVDAPSLYSDGMGSAPTPQATVMTFLANNNNSNNKRFSSPLFRLNHVPLPRLFMSSPNGA
ncbi:hypothetical protein M422DRAFT_261489 [Sphaerobolus stellatus SS14]|uniref:Uncharacterized protein n=1 Tax=Sphaerobolus stellatus (strain SS14) TaxID=990650 RepID=A0A0C9VFG7_SPHS4|nr:hypothetical protein M422DRAFT_261489 [Sphaerobolus stellatus SS14]